MTALQIYWQMFVVTLVAYNAFSYLWIKKNNGLDKKTKLVVTGGCVIFLSIAAGVVVYDHYLHWTCWFILAFQSLTVWATAVDATQGLLLHSNIFYLGNSWPDKQLKVVVQNGYLYFVFKMVLLFFAFSLTYKLL